MRILILGGTGMLGHKLWQRLGARFPDTYVTIRRTRADCSRFRIFDDPCVLENVDLADSAQLSQALDSASPDVIVNCVALTKRHESEAGPACSIVLNAWLPHRIAEWAARNDARLITVSTDCVFDGKKGGYTEQDAPNALDVYGRTKALGEVDCGNALTIRTSFIGRELDDGTQLLEWFLAQQGKTIHGFRAALYTGISSLYCADLIGDIIERFPRLNGLYQVTSEVINKYDLLCLAREAYAIDVKIEPDDTVVVRRDLDGTKFRQETGIVTPPWRAMMNELATDPTPYFEWRHRGAV
jgi:dTDP-4-dehydrorhamnose reductase